MILRNRGSQRQLRGQAGPKSKGGSLAVNTYFKEAVPPPPHSLMYWIRISVLKIVEKEVFPLNVRMSAQMAKRGIFFKKKMCEISRKVSFFRHTY